MIDVIAIITCKPGMRPAVLEKFNANIPAVLKEAGCIDYRPVTDTASGLGFQTTLGEDTFMVIEKWENTAALEAHSQAPHMKAYGLSVADLLADRAIHILD